jgi:hypothetical protein
MIFPSAPHTGQSSVISKALLLMTILCPILITGCSSWPYHQQHMSRARYDFALIGDVPYRPADATNTFPNMIRHINQQRLAFVVHDGDIKNGSSPCDDDVLERCQAQFQTFKHPFVLVFGDNEWTDCGNAAKQEDKNRLHDPEERLAKCRDLFSQGNHTMGQRTMPLDRQSNDPTYSEYRENVRWNYGQVRFVGLNLPGSGNNVAIAEEFQRRNEANLAWLSDSFELATQEKARAVMVIIQANPQFNKKKEDKARAGFNDFLALLEEKTVAFKRPVVLVHGDSHYFRIDKPMVGSRSGRRVENFTRVETFGYPDVHWLRVSVDWRDRNVFTFRQEIVEANLVNHELTSEVRSRTP